MKQGFRYRGNGLPSGSVTVVINFGDSTRYLFVTRLEHCLELQRWLFENENPHVCYEKISKRSCRPRAKSEAHAP